MGLSLNTYTVVALNLAFIYVCRCLAPDVTKMSHIPTLGPSAPILSYWGAFKWLLGSRDVMRRGYQKYKGTVFKIATFNDWVVCVPGTKLADEMRKASELSSREAAKRQLQLKYTAGEFMVEDSYHVGIIRNELTKSLPMLFPDIQDEVQAACNDSIPESDGWVSIVAWDVVLQVVARVTSRVFVGLPFCRNPEYIKCSIDYAIDLITAATIITQFPDFLKPYVSSLTKVERSFNIGMKHLGPEIERRLRLIDQHGSDYPEKPFDYLSWVIDYAQEKERTLHKLLTRVMMTSIAAIHTSSITLTNALFQVAAHPEYAEILREEVESTVKAYGWSKDSIDKMLKMDSLLKECLRVYSIGSHTLPRKATKDFTFSDGTFIPEGTSLCSPVLEVQCDPEYWGEDSGVFNPWRFSDARAKDLDGDPSKYDFSSTSIELHTFGHGRNACPGRWFSANELKTLLAHLIANYDIKMEKEGVVPPLIWFGGACVPDNKAKVLLKRRKAD